MSFLATFIQQQAQYVYKPEKWARDLLGFEPNEFQKQALRDYIEIGHCAWSCGSGVGKTTTLAIIVLHFLSTRPFPIIPCTAPSEHQLHDVLWAEIHRWMSKSNLLMQMFTWTQEKIYLKGYKETWFAVARTAVPKPGSHTVEGLQGFHAEHICFIVDECSGVADQIMGAVDGAMSTPQAKAVLASNPTRNTGYFYDITYNPQYKNLYKDLWAVRFVDAETINAPYIDKSYIERLKVQYGADSDYVRMRVKGLPPRTEFNALISPEQVYEAHKRTLQPSGHIFLSCDPARYGEDDTVFYVRDGRVIVERIFVHGLDTQQVATIGLDLFHKYDPVEYRIDAIGIGAGVVDATKKQLGAKKGRVIGIQVGEKAVDEQQFKNKRAEILWNLRTVIDNISIPIATPLLDEELPKIRYGWDSVDKKLGIESKDSLRSSIGRSPNDADSLALNCADLKTPNAIVFKAYFMVGQTSNLVNNGIDADVNIDGDGDGNGRQKIGNVLRGIFGKSRGGIGINRFGEFKDDLATIQNDDLHILDVKH